MGLRINTNVAALSARRHLGTSTSALRRNIARLSSGNRINGARDDAAGLSIVSRFTARIRGLGQAVRNTNDGLSLVQTAEGALQETSNIIQRVRELAVQSANATNTAGDRVSLQSEVGALVGEVERIATSTQFNSTPLLDGTFVGARLHVGAGSRETIDLRIADSRSTSLGRQARVVGTQIDLGQVLDGARINGVTLRDIEATDDQLSTRFGERSAIAKAHIINDATAFTGVRALVDAAVFTGSSTPQAGALDVDDYIEINGIAISGVSVEDNDANGALVDAINAAADQTGVLASKDEESRIVLTAADGRNIEVRTLTATAGTVSGLQPGANLRVRAGGLTLQSEDNIVLDLSLASDAAALGIGVGAGENILGVNSANAFATVDVSTVAGANRTIDIADVALRQVQRRRSSLGAVQNRLESTLENLAANAENLAAARSRIRDADFASETASLARNSILQQAGVSVLAQANAQGEQALSLLDVGFAAGA